MQSGLYISHMVVFLISKSVSLTSPNSETLFSFPGLHCSPSHIAVALLREDGVSQGFSGEPTAQGGTLGDQEI